MSHVSGSCHTATSCSGSAKMHSSQADNVHVQSVVQTETQSKVSLENAKKITDLMARLGSTHTQVDEYSRRRTEEISEAVSESIKKLFLKHNIINNNFSLMLIHAQPKLNMTLNLKSNNMLLNLILKKPVYLLNLNANLMFVKNLFLKPPVNVSMISMKKLIV